MKKLLLVVILAMLTTSCGGSNGDADLNNDINGENDIPTEMSIDAEGAGSVISYFPIWTNKNFRFESPTHPQLTQNIYVTYTDGVRIQRRAASEDISSTEVLQLMDGELRFIFGEPSFYFFEDLIAVEPIMDLLLLQEPLVVGNTWEMDSNGTSEITSMDAEVSVMGETMIAMEVTTEFIDGRSQWEYYVRDLGLVKTVYTTFDGHTIEIVLTEITEQATLIVPVDFFYPDPESELEYGIEEREIQIYTNKDLAAIFTDELQIAGRSGFYWLPGGTVINSIDIDRASDALILDLSDNGITSEDALQALADTLGHFYGVTRVRPMADGQDFVTDETTFGPNDFISVTVLPDQLVHE